MVSVSWDRNVCIYDDGNNDGLTLLRVIRFAHDRDITCVAFSYQLSVIATGAADGSLRLWDFQVRRRPRPTQLTARVTVDRLASRQPVQLRISVTTVLYLLPLCVTATGGVGRRRACVRAALMA